MASRKELNDVLVGFKKMQERIVGAVDAGLYAGGSIIMSDSIPRVPVDFGDLRGSGYVTLPENHTVEIGYGGSAKGYAVPVHERTELRHEVGEAKYLEKAASAKKKDAREAVRGRIRRALKNPSYQPQRIPKTHPVHPDENPPKNPRNKP